VAKTVTGPERLGWILGWVNGESTDGRGDVRRFVRSFDGSPEVGYVEVPEETELPEFIREVMPRPSPTTDEQLDDLRVQLQLLLEQGFGVEGVSGLASAAGASLRFAVRSAGREKPRWTQTKGGNRTRVGGDVAWKRYQGAGAYVMRVYGDLVDVVPFLVMHLLTQPDMILVQRCPVCEKFMARNPGARGRPRETCSEVCWMRRYADRKEAAKQPKPRRRAR
jgi:hypothetical protein